MAYLSAHPLSQKSQEQEQSIQNEISVFMNTWSYLLDTQWANGLFSSLAEVQRGDIVNAKVVFADSVLGD